jgi:hypothetical protein
MNSQQLVSAYQEFIGIADDVSAIPKYVGGQAGGGGAGRTASGLAMLMGNASKILQSVSANIDRDVLEPALLQLADLIMLTDTSGLLTGEEKISVKGVSVAIQRETLRQRQIEFLSQTQNPLDNKIMGLRGRAAVLRSVGSTIGLPGEEIVPPAQEIEKMMQQEQQGGNNEAITQHVEAGIQAGVKAGVQRITTELTAGGLAMQAHVPEGPPVHIGTEPEQQPATNNPSMDLGPGGEAARQASGMQHGPISRQGMAPNVANLTSHQPGRNALPLSPGVG